MQVFSAEGHRLGLIPTPQACSNCCFSPDERRLFVTAKQHLYALDLLGVQGGLLTKTSEGLDAVQEHP